MRYQYWNLDEIKSERDIPGLIPNRPYPRYVRRLGEFGDGFRARTSNLRELLREADQLYDYNLVEALLIYRRMAEIVKGMNTLECYVGWVRRIQDSLLDCWDQLGLEDEIDNEWDLWADFNLLVVLDRMAQLESRHGG